MGGGVIFDGGSARDSGEIDALVNNLSQREDTYIVLESMNELSEIIDDEWINRRKIDPCQ